jgi:hypothetical protein
LRVEWERGRGGGVEPGTFLKAAIFERAFSAVQLYALFSICSNPSKRTRLKKIAEINLTLNKPEYSIFCF